MYMEFKIIYFFLGRTPRNAGQILKELLRKQGCVVDNENGDYTPSQKTKVKWDHTVQNINF